MPIKPFQNFTPKIHTSAYIDEMALVIGQVSIDEHSSLWPMTVARGDVNTITIGKNTNIQDNTTLHVTHKHTHRPQGNPLIIGDYVTVGHNVVLHGCTVEDFCLIGMGTIILDGSVIEPYTLIGAGSLVAENKKLEGGYLWLGRPVRKVRALSEAEKLYLGYSAEHYVELKDNYVK